MADPMTGGVAVNGKARWGRSRLIPGLRLASFQIPERRNGSHCRVVSGTKYLEDENHARKAQEESHILANCAQAGNSNFRPKPPKEPRGPIAIGRDTFKRYRKRNSQLWDGN